MNWYQTGGSQVSFS